MALHGLALAPVMDSNLAKLETMGPRPYFIYVRTVGPRVSPLLHVRYDRIARLALVARCRAVTQALVPAVWEAGLQLPTDGLIGRALPTPWALGCRPQEGWWDVPGQSESLHVVKEPMRVAPHRAHEALRCHVVQHLEMWRPFAFGDWEMGWTVRHAARHREWCPSRSRPSLCVGSSREPCELPHGSVVGG